MFNAIKHGFGIRQEADDQPRLLKVGNVLAVEHDAAAGGDDVAFGRGQFLDQRALKGPEMRFKINAETFSHGWELPARLTGEGDTPSGHDIPPDARYKPGSGGQLIAFVPSLDLVVTRQTGSSGAWEYAEYLRRACAAILVDDR